MLAYSIYVQRTLHEFIGLTPTIPLFNIIYRIWSAILKQQTKILQLD